LAAGASRRMGGSPKALLDYRGQTFLSRVASLLAAVCDPVIVVLPPAGLPCPPGVLATVNPAPERGMLTSLQCGLRAVPAGKGAMFTLVDIPNVKPETIELLASTVGSAPIAIPRHQGRRGHPIVAAPDLIPEVLALPVTAMTRDVIDAHATEILYIDVDDPGILFDIDEPADYERLLAEVAR
jgi:molybdenum cofactor cytidylyltransferase